jgi:hypothetical protein
MVLLVLTVSVLFLFRGLKLEALNRSERSDYTLSVPPRNDTKSLSFVIGFGLYIFIFRA